MEIRSVYDTDDFNGILAQHSKVVADFTADWCGPCKRMKPEFKKLRQKYPDVFFCTIDVDNCAELTGSYKVASMPTFLFFQKGTLLPKLTVTGADLPAIEASLRTIMD